MKPENVQRFRFSTAEIIAAMMPNVPRSEYQEIRVEGDEVLIEIVNPKGEDAPQRPAVHDAPSMGPNEALIRKCLSEPAFLKFGKVETVEEAETKLLHRMGISAFSDLDNGVATKHALAELQNITGRYAVWLQGN